MESLMDAGSGRFVYGCPKENVNVLSPNMRLAKLYERTTFIQIPFNCLGEAKQASQNCYEKLTKLILN